MSGYGYTFRGYSTYNGLTPKTDDWSTSSNPSDHVCRPVIIDAEGRKQPIVLYSPNPNTEYSVTKAEAIVEHVHSPLITEYRHTSTTKVEPRKAYGVVQAEPWKDYGVVQDQWRRPSSPVENYGVVQDQWRRPSSPVKDQWGRPSSPVKDYGAVQDQWRRPSSPVKDQWRRPSSPVKDYGAVQDQWRRPSSPVKDYGAVQDQWRRPSSPVYDRPQKVEDFITKVQTEASRPNKFSPLSATQWRRTPNSTGYHNNNGYGDYSDSSNNEWNKPSGNTIRNGSYDDYNRKNDSGMEPNMVTAGGWARPSRSTWSAPTNASLSNPTTDIGTAMEMLKEAVKPSSGTTASHYSVPISSGPKRDTYSDTIDSREAAKRYGNFNSSSRPVNTNSTTIDSREAAKRYGNFNSSSRPVNTYSTTIDSREPTIDSRQAMKKYGGTTV